MNHVFQFIGLSDERGLAAHLKAALPNAITLLALFFGMTGLTYAAEGNFSATVACVLIAALLDGCDGRVARATGSASRFGAELDSLADVICFGAIPAYALYAWALASEGSVAWIACLVFAGCSALRLARFNVAAQQPNRAAWMSNYFTGMPTPGAAFVALLPIYLEGAGWVEATSAHAFALVFLPILALLMVSTWPTYSAKSVSRKAVRLLFLPTMGIAGLTVYGLFTAPWQTLAVMALAYLASLPASLWTYRRRMSRSLT